MTDIRLESEAVYARFRRVLGRARRDVLAKLATVPTDLSARRRWLYRELETIDSMLKGKAKLVNGKLVIQRKGLADILATEVHVEELYEKGLKDAQQRLAAEFPIVSRGVTEYAANYEFGWLRNLSDGARAKVTTAIRTGVLLGEPTDEIARRITGAGLARGAWYSVEARARTIARTETARIVIGGRMDGYRELDVTRVRFEGRETVCKVCSELLGKEWPIEEAPAMPVHPNCVHDLVPVERRGVRLG